MNLPKSFFSMSIKVTCNGGADLFQCVSDAVLLAMREGCMVEFKHNSRQYTVSPSDIQDVILKQHPMSPEEQRLT